MSDKRRSQTQVRMTQDQVERLITRAEVSVKAYLLAQQDAAIERLEKNLARPRSFWERLFRLKRPDASCWTRRDWVTAARNEFYSYSIGNTTYYNTPWDSDHVREETDAINTLKIVLRYAREQGGADVHVDAHEVEVLEVIAGWAPPAREPAYRNEQAKPV